MKQTTRILQTVDDVAGIICGIVTAGTGYIGIAGIGIVGISVVTGVILIIIGIATLAITTAKLVMLSLHRD